MSELGNRECSWLDEDTGAEVINTAALGEYFGEYITLPDWDIISPRHFLKFVEFIHANYPQWIGLEFWLWADIGGGC